MVEDIQKVGERFLIHDLDREGNQAFLLGGHSGLSSKLFRKSQRWDYRSGTPDFYILQRRAILELSDLILDHYEDVPGPFLVRYFRHHGTGSPDIEYAIRVHLPLFS